MPRHKSRVNFDPETKNKSFSTTTKKPSQFQFIRWNQVNFGLPHNKTNFDAPRHENQINFDPDSKPRLFRPPHKTKSILIPALKSSQSRSPKLKSSLIRLPTQQPSQFIVNTKTMSFSARVFARYTYRYMFLWYSSDTYHIRTSTTRVILDVSILE